MNDNNTTQIVNNKNLKLNNIKKYIPLDTYVGDNLESVLLAFVWAFAYFVVIRKKIIIVWKDFNNTEGV